MYKYKGIIEIGKIKQEYIFKKKLYSVIYSFSIGCVITKITIHPIFTSIITPIFITKYQILKFNFF